MAKYNSSTYDRELEEELLKSRYGLLMQQRDEAIANNNATGVYTNWNGGSVSGQDMWNAVQDSLKYGYDIQLDPRNGNGTRGAINDLLLDAGEMANADAIAGNGTYDQNRQNYLDQIGWTDYQSVFKNLQETGKTGLNALDGRSLEEAYGLGATKLNGNPMTGFTLEEQLAAELAALPTAEDLYAMEQAQAQQNYINSHLSPLMQQGGGEKGGAWGYNQEEDPVWDAILNQYTRAGEKGMNDVLAQLSARTGGLASSYAGQVAQQTMNDYMQGATDYIPQLYEAAYGRYMDEQEMNIAAEERAYQRQQDALDRQLAADQTAWERQAYADELAYNREQDALDRQFAEDQFNWEQQKYWNSLNKSSGGSSTGSNISRKDIVSQIEDYGYQPSDAEMQQFGISQELVDAILSSRGVAESAGYDEFAKRAATFTDDASLDRYLSGLVTNGLLTEAEAQRLYLTYMTGTQEEEEDDSFWDKILGVFR